jgi:hypothetical protein
MYLEDIRLRKKTDFIENEKTVIKAVDYFMSSNVDERNINRVACSRFIIKYAEKTPFITMTIDASLLKVYEGNSDILVMYMGLWLKSAINNKKEKDSFHEEYIYTEIYKYSKVGKGIVQTDIIKSLINAGNKGEIKKWIKDLKKE